MASQADVKRLITEIEERLSELRSLVASAPDQAPVHDVGDKVLGEVLLRGASVNRQELYAIAAEQGMDRRGLGGFFRESGQKSLLDLPGTDRIVLTAYGADRAQRYLNRRQVTSHDSPEPNLARLAEPSFAEDWNSAEDAAYDDL